jgi:two-component system KDP operon response regulator KdpE
LSGKKILIIDDDRDLLLGLTPRLKVNGYQVSCATDVTSAMAVALKELPDLIILDLGLPPGDGFDVLGQIKGLAGLATTPIIVLSARDPVGNERRALDGGAVAFFQKPPDNYEFLNAIRRTLGEAIVLSTFSKT